MENVIHVAACALDRPLKGIHGACHVLFEWISDQHMIFLRIAVVGTGARDVVDPLVHMMFAAGATRHITLCVWWWGRRGRARSGSLLCKKFCTGYETYHCCHLAKKLSPAVDVH